MAEPEGEAAGEPEPGESLPGVNLPDFDEDLLRAEELELHLIHGSAVQRLTARWRLAADARRAPAEDRATGTGPIEPRPPEPVAVSAPEPVGGGDGPAAPDGAAAAKRAAPPRKAAPAKKTAAAKKATPAKKATVAKKATPAKRAAAATKAPSSTKAAATKQAARAKKAGPAKKATPAEKAAAPVPEPAPPGGTRSRKRTPAARGDRRRPAAAVDADRDEPVDEESVWSDFTAGLADSDERMAELDEQLARTPRLGRVAARMFSL